MASAAGGRITAGAGASLVGSGQRDRVPEATCYLGNLEPRVTEEIVWELFMQCGPVVSVYLPKDRVTNEHQGYGFVEFKSEQDADYAIKILNMLRVYDKPIKVNKSAKDRMEQDVGANLFVGNLDPEVDEKYLYDTFSAFGVVTRTPKVMRDPDTGESRGFGFVSFATFEASDAAIEAMNGQFLSNRPVSVMYAYKKDSRGERHGTPAERLLAQRNRSMREEKRPHTLFAAGPGQAPQGLGMGMPPGVSRMPPPPPPAGMAGAFRGMPPPPPPPHMMMYNGGGPPPGMMGQGMPPPPPPPGMMGQGMPPPPPPPGMMGQGMPPPPPPPGMMGQGMPPPPPPPEM